MRLGVANAASSEAVCEEEDASGAANAAMDEPHTTPATIPDSSNACCPDDSGATPVTPVQGETGAI